jgi:hypothetical protein
MMKMRSFNTAAVCAAALAMAGCKTDGTSAPAAPSDVSTGATTGTTGSTTGTATPGTGGSGSSIPTLVSVNLQNVLNDLSVSLQVNRDNVPVTAQVPIAVAASVCGVTVDALAASAANGHATCTATTATPQLTQAVQQQMSTGGNVGGGPQTMGTPTPTTSTTTTPTTSTPK